MEADVAISHKMTINKNGLQRTGIKCRKTVNKLCKTIKV